MVTELRNEPPIDPNLPILVAGDPEKKSLLKESIKILNDRERKILEARKLSSNPKTLDELSKKYKISRERIRQIETKAFEKLQKAMLNSHKSKNLLPAN